MNTNEARAEHSGQSRDGERPDLVATVLKQLTDEIMSGRFEPGVALPPEGELAKSHDVSRTVIREAMRSLRAQGLVEMSQGRAARVRPPDPEAVVASLDMLLRRNCATLLHLVEVRRPLESEIAALAAERANDEHLRQLERAVHDLGAASGLQDRIEADVRFHRILAEATGNPVFVLLLETLAGFLRESRQRTLAYSGVESALQWHRAVFQAVRARDANKAREAMQEHLRWAARDLNQLRAKGARPTRR
ncbi:MAG: FadR family transcriptional regulator [Verrucomicrobia bacterium]|nr:FadR family transcriptional regulator [Verrucomicrobiota bacterium]